MKKLMFTLIFAMAGIGLFAQNLLDIYKSGTVTLVPDTEYARNVNWNRALESWTDTMVGRWVGDRKSLQVAPDGSAIVSHHFRDFYTVFSPNGAFEKELKVKNQQGQPYRSLPHLHGVLDGEIYYSGLNNMGVMLCFDRSGALKKTLQLDYSARQIIPLPNRKFALLGWVLWTDRVREFVAIVDYETNEEKIIWDKFRPMAGSSPRQSFYYQYTFASRGMISLSTMPFLNIGGRNNPPIIAHVDNKLIITVPDTGEIRTYDLEGRFISSQTIDWAPAYVSVEEQKEIQQKAIERYRNLQNPQFASWVSAAENRAARDQLVREMENDLRAIDKPIPLPVFSTVIKDSDDNLLFFEFPKEEGANKFNVWVYGQGGNFVAQSSFAVEGYELEIKPSKMVFHNGYLYALLKKEGAEGVPLRVARFKLRGN